MELDVYGTPLGPLELVANENGIVSVKFLFGKLGSRKSDEPYEETSDKKARSHLEVCRKWLDAYFGGILLEMDNPPPKPKLVFPDKGPFFNMAWEALLDTEVGDTITYKELACRSGSPMAARAAGQAVKKHSLPILIPCHRVVPSSRHGRKRSRAQSHDKNCDGEDERMGDSKSMTGNYSGGDGPATKEWFLEHEQKMLKKTRR